VPLGRERNTGRRSDIRAQRAGMIPGVPSQDLIRLRKLNEFPAPLGRKSPRFLTWMKFTGARLQNIVPSTD
jgi:hypothetical protein